MFASKPDDAPASQLSDAQVLGSLRDGKMQHYNLEADIGNATRAANLRRLYLAETIGDSGKAAGIKSLPFEGYDYQALVGANCENVIGYIPIPVGVFGPLKVDGKLYHIPMATTEGCLVASANRGARAITQCGGAVTALLKDGITRSPVLRTPSLREAESIVQWLGVPENFERIRSAFNSSSRFASLQAIKTAVAGRSLFLRFACTTGDAMGMNMVSKGTQRALAELATVFPDTKLVSMPYSLCTAVRFAPLTILFRCFRSAFQAIIAATRSLLPSTGLKGVAKVWLRRQLCPAVSSRTFSKPLLTAWSRPTYSRTTSAPLLQVQLVVSMPMPLIWLPLFSLQLVRIQRRLLKARSASLRWRKHLKVTCSYRSACRALRSELSGVAWG